MRKSEFKKYALNYIKAITARGGDGYEKWEEYDNDFCEWCFDKWIKEQPRVKGMLYRGYMMNRSQFFKLLGNVGNIITPNEIYNQPYPSFTTSEVRATMYINDYEAYGLNPSKVLFIVKCRGLYGIDISNHSYYPEETEHKFIKDAQFKVEAIETKGVLTKIYLIEV